MITISNNIIVDYKQIDGLMVQGDHFVSDSTEFKSQQSDLS